MSRILTVLATLESLKQVDLRSMVVSYGLKGLRGAKKDVLVHELAAFFVNAEQTGHLFDFLPAPANTTPETSNNMTPKPLTKTAVRALEIAEETIAHPQVKDKTPEGVARRVARYLNKEGFTRQAEKGARFFTAKTVLELMANPPVAEQGDEEAAPSLSGDVEAMDNLDEAAGQ